MRCKYFPHECIGMWHMCPYTKEGKCSIQPINLQAEVVSLEEEWKEVVGF